MATALTFTYLNAMTRLRRAAIGQVGALWDSAGLTDDDVLAFVAAADDLDSVLRSTAVATTDAYLQMTLAAQTGRSPRALGLDPEAYRRAAPSAQVWGRPFVAARMARSEGHTWAEAVAIGRARATQLAATNVQLAARGAARDGIARDPRVVGYRRVLGPGKNCGLCIVASTQRYHKADLMPIHPSCGCAVDPIAGTGDPGQIVGPQTLEYVASQADDATRNALSRLRIDPADLPAVEVVDHGELGPVLWDRRHSFATL